MKVRARLVVFGALLPTIGLVLSTLLAGQLFTLSLLRAVDEALLGQAAIESVSLFDGPGGEPHFHLHDSPLIEGERVLARGMVAVYGPTGELVLKFPLDAPVPAQLFADSVPEHVPASVRWSEDEYRQLIVNLRAKDGTHYTLLEAMPLAPVRATTQTFYRVTLSVCAVVALLLFGVQLGQARRFSRRVIEMANHLPLLRSSRFDTLSPDDSGDELSDLRSALNEASVQLKAARDRQERLIANTAHELKTPLTLMRTEIDLALRKERSPDELRIALTETRHEVERLARLASDLLDLASRDKVSVARTRSNLREIAQRAIEGERVQAEERGVEITLTGPDDASLMVDPQEIRRLLDNLLSNALKFSPHGSQIRVRLEHDVDRWLLSVEDEGPGVAPSERTRIFDPFYRTPGAPKGTGLGLAIAREIARAHHGDLLVAESEKGARFVAELPDRSRLDS